MEGREADVEGLLTNECKPYLESFGLTDIRSLSKYKFKREVKLQIFKKNKNELISISQNYKKINQDEFKNLSFEMQSYFKDLSVQQSRLQFKINSKMTPRVASLFTRDPKYIAIDHLCVGCSVTKTGAGPIADPPGGSPERRGERFRDSESHIVRCLAYADLRQNLDLNIQTHMLTYIQRVIDRRIAQEKDNNDI